MALHKTIMEAILLIGMEGASLKRIKSHLIRRGFQAVLLEANEIRRLEELKERFRLGILDAAGEPRLSPLVDRIRAASGGKELPLLALIKEGH